MIAKALLWLWPRLPVGKRGRAALMWLLSPKFRVGVSGLVLDDEGRVLLLRHTYRGSKPWGMPGGGLKPGESLEDCLRREVIEETGLRVEVLRLVSAAAHPSRRLVDTIYLCRLEGDDRDGSLEHFKSSPEVVEARFFEHDSLPDGVPWAQRRLIRVAWAQADGGRRTTDDRDG